MKSNSKKIKRLVLLAFFIAIELVLMFTPLGYIPLGVIRATTLHIPVIAAGIMLGRKDGAIVGFVFGLTSLLVNTFTPTATSFVFSPFITIGGVTGNFASLIIVFVPRILLGYLASVFYELFKKITKKPTISVMITAVIVTFMHTVLVMGGIYIFFAAPYASAKGVEVGALFGIIMGVIGTNGVMEMIIAALLDSGIVRVGRPLMERWKLNEE